MQVALTPQATTPDREIGPYRRKDYEALPDEPRCELIRGRFCLSPSPAPLHQIVLLLLAEQFSAFAEAAGGLVLIAPMDVALADHTVVQPDLLYLTASNCEAVAQTARVDCAPALVVEILSSGTAARDRGVKLGLYAEAGVQEYWLVDPSPSRRSGRPGPSIDFLVQEDALEGRAGRSGGQPRRFVAQVPSGAWYQSPVLAEVRLDVAKLWRRAASRAARVAAPEK